MKASEVFKMKLEKVQGSKMLFKTTCSFKLQERARLSLDSFELLTALSRETHCICKYLHLYGNI